MGSELYAHFTVASDQTIESQELRELAEDAGGGEIPMEGEEGRIVARLDPASKVAEGQEAELWVDATRLQLFDPEDGRNLMVGGSGPAATTGDGQGGERAQEVGGGAAGVGRRAAGRRARTIRARYLSSRRSRRTIVSSSALGCARSRRMASTTASSHSWVRRTR